MDWENSKAKGDADELGEMPGHMFHPVLQRLQPKLLAYVFFMNCIAACVERFQRMQSCPC